MLLPMTVYPIISPVPYLFWYAAFPSHVFLNPHLITYSVTKYTDEYFCNFSAVIEKLSNFKAFSISESLSKFLGSNSIVCNTASVFKQKK